MKEYLIKYEDYNGEVHTKIKAGYDKRSVIENLSNCKEVYWIRLNDKVLTNFIYDNN